MTLLFLDPSVVNRILVIFTTHSFIIIFFLFLAFKILRRNYNKLTLTLSGFYILSAMGFVLNLIFLPLSTTFAGFVTYIIAAYTIVLSPIFLVLFILNLLYLKENFKSFNLIKIIYFISYSILLFLLLLLFPEGITISSLTNWTPKFSWFFLITFYIFFSIYIVIPTIFLSRKLYNKFNDQNLRKKFRYFFIGILGYFFGFYGLILYNTWHDPLFRIIWSIISLIVIPSGFFIYYGIGQKL